MIRDNIDIDFHFQLGYNSLMPDSQEIFKNILKSKNFKITAPRQLIVDCFLKTSEHVSAEDLYEIAKRKDPRIGYATVHRTLKLMTEAGIARVVDFGDGKKRFERAVGQAHHDHFVCEKCGKIIEFFDAKLEAEQEKICRRYCFTGKTHVMKIFGVCKKCWRRARRGR